MFKKVVDFNAITEDLHKKAVVRIGLDSGFIDEGTPLKVDKDGNAIFSSYDNSLSYISTKNISGIQLLNPEIMMEILTDGAYFQVNSSDIPTKLELKREFKTVGDTLKNDYGFTLETNFFEQENNSDIEFFQFYQFLEKLPKIIENIAKDVWGKESLNLLENIKIIATEGDSHLYEECWTKVYFKPLTNALENVCVDDLGKEAITKSLKKIIIKNEAETGNGDRIASFKDDILTLDNKPTTNVDDIEQRTKAIQKTLEDSL